LDIGFKADWPHYFSRIIDMTGQLAPSRNPTNNSSLAGVFDVVMQKFLQDLNDMLPAQIIAYDRASNLAQVQPLIDNVLTDGTIQSQSPVMSIPVVQIGGGGFMLNFPIKAGDLGWIKANDRDISLFKQSWGKTIPNTGLKHDFSSAIFIPSILTGFIIAASDSENVTLQNLAGTLRFSMGLGAAITNQIGYSQSPNAILDLQSTNKAFKFPAMTTSQKNAIPSPQAGFAVFDTNLGGVSVFNGSVWS
jgi:hypothetical protein